MKSTPDDHQPLPMKVTSRKLKDSVLKNVRLALRNLADVVGISKRLVNKILKDISGLRMCRISFDSKKIQFFRKKNRYVGMCACVLTVNWSWSTLLREMRLGYYSETINQSSECRPKDELIPKKPHQSRLKIIAMLTVFFHEDNCNFGICSKFVTNYPYCGMHSLKSILRERNLFFCLGEIF